MWNESSMIPRQLPKIGEKLAKNFLKLGLDSFQKIENEKVVLKPQPSADESYDDLLSKMFAKSHIKQ